MNEKFKPLSFWKELFLKKEQLQDYYAEKRKYNLENGQAIQGMEWRGKLHGLLLKLIELNRKYIDKQSLTILKDERTETDKPVIYAITHIGKFDYQIVSEAIKEHQIPFSGDPESMYRTFDGFLLAMNGIIYCDTDNKEDRKVALDTSIELLNKGNNLLIYPEGVWNVSSNLLILPLFPGIINMARVTGCDIVPIAIEQYDKDFIVNIGKNFKVPNFEFKSEEAKKEYVDKMKYELRDAMATLRWEIFETLPMEERKNIGKYAEANRKFVDKRLYEWFNKKLNKPYYDDELIKHRVFREKGVTNPQEAFDYFKNLQLKRENAFAFRRDLSLPDEINEEIEYNLKENNKRGR